MPRGKRAISVLRDTEKVNCGKTLIAIFYSLLSDRFVRFRAISQTNLADGIRAAQHTRYRTVGIFFFLRNHGSSLHACRAAYRSSRRNSRAEEREGRVARSLIREAFYTSVVTTRRRRGSFYNHGGETSSSGESARNSLRARARARTRTTNATTSPRGRK